MKRNRCVYWRVTSLEEDHVFILHILYSDVSFALICPLYFVRMRNLVENKKTPGGCCFWPIGMVFVIFIFVEIK